MKTIKELVDNVTLAAQNMGMDLTAEDVGTIVGLFLEGMAETPSEGGVNSTHFDNWLRMIAAECQSVKKGG